MKTLFIIALFLSLVSGAVSQTPFSPSKLTCEQREALFLQALRNQAIQNAIAGGVVIVFFILGFIWGYYERKKKGEMRAVLGRPYNDSERGGEFNSGLCDNVCVPRICLPTTFFPCFQLAFNRSDLDNRECNWQDALMVPSLYQNRQSLRVKYEMRRDPCYDCCCVMFCQLCVVCQDTREIEIREAMSSPTAAGGYASMPDDNGQIQTGVPLQSGIYMPPTANAGPPV